MAMRGSGYSDSVTSEVCAALGILAKYGVLGVGVGLSNGTPNSLSGYLNVSALEQPSQQQQSVGASIFGNAVGSIGANLESFLNSQSQSSQRSQLERFEAFDPFRNAQATAPISLNNNSFGLAAAQNALGAAAAAQATLGALSKSPTPGEIGSKDAKNVEIPEVIVGAILGE